MSQNHTPTVNLPATAAECALAPRNFRNPEPANNVLGTGSRYNATDPDDIVKEISFFISHIMQIFLLNFQIKVSYQ